VAVADSGHADGNGELLGGGTGVVSAMSFMSIVCAAMDGAAATVSIAENTDAAKGK